MAKASSHCLVSTPALLQLLGHCDATAAAIHRFNQLSALASGIQDEDEWWARIIHLWSEYDLHSIRDVITGCDNGKKCDRIILDAYLRSIGRNAEAELRRLGFPEEKASIERAVAWLIKVFPAGDNFSLIWHQRAWPLKSQEEDHIGRAVIDKKHNLQVCLVIEYMKEIRNPLLGTLILEGNPVPAEVNDRIYWMRWECRGNGPAITNEELLTWFHDPAHETHTKIETTFEPEQLVLPVPDLVATGEPIITTTVPILPPIGLLAGNAAMGRSTADIGNRKEWAEILSATLASAVAGVLEAAVVTVRIDSPNEAMRRVSMNDTSRSIALDGSVLETALDEQVFAYFKALVTLWPKRTAWHVLGKDTLIERVKPSRIYEKIDLLSRTLQNMRDTNADGHLLKLPKCKDLS